MKALKFAILTIVLLTISTFFACSDDDLKPITLRDYEDTTINLMYPNETGYSFLVQGGDEKYSVKSSNSNVVTTEMISPSDVSLKAIGLGEATVTITDQSSNTLVLYIKVDYQTQNFVVKRHHIGVIGDDLTENQRKAIIEKQLAEIPVKVDGGYKFIYTDRPNNKGKAIIYTETYGSKGIETTFEFKEFKNEGETQFSTYGYEIIINNEKRIFHIGRYNPSPRSSEPIPMALMEDITLKVQKEYPKAELVLASQSIGNSSY